jgi:hypothetical protein
MASVVICISLAEISIERILILASKLLDRRRKILDYNEDTFSPVVDTGSDFAKYFEFFNYFQRKKIIVRTNDKFSFFRAIIYWMRMIQKTQTEFPANFRHIGFDLAFPIIITGTVVLEIFEKFNPITHVGIYISTRIFPSRDLNIAPIA